MAEQVKSWKEVHRILKIVRFNLREIQEHAIKMTKKTDETVAYLKQAYLAAPKLDGTLFSLAPIATNTIVEHLMNQIFKTEDGYQRIFSTRIKRNMLFDPTKTPDFVLAMEEAIAWLTKFEKEELEKIT